jgi:Ca2+/Na+ antiporter
MVGHRLGISHPYCLISSWRSIRGALSITERISGGLSTDRSQQLAVRVAAVFQHKVPSALGNVLGSTITNVLGALSLGLLVYSGSINFDYSAKVYFAFLFLITIIFILLAYFGTTNRITGGILAALFIVYLI